MYCNYKDSSPDSSSYPKQPDLQICISQVLNVKVEDNLTAAQVAAAVGADVGDAGRNGALHGWIEAKQLMPFSIHKSYFAL